MTPERERALDQAFRLSEAHKGAQPWDEDRIVKAATTFHDFLNPTTQEDKPPSKPQQGKAPTPPDEKPSVSVPSADNPPEF